MDADFLVVGSGIAGLSYAMRVADLGTVVLVTKKKEVDTATNLAQGGIAAVLAEDDSGYLHEKDTVVSGAGLCDEDVVRMVIEQGPLRIQDLIKIGVDFIRDGSGNLSLGREGGHSRRRVAHAYDLTGREIERALVEKVNNHPNVKVFEQHTVVDLLLDKSKKGGGRCCGAYVLEDSGRVIPYRARVTTVCTGGCGKVYLYTSNPDISTGDGIAMAYRAGAKVANMEFVQFHPTCLYHPQAKNFLISEAVRGEGALLVDRKGKRFMDKYDKRGELATRDKVARAIDREMKEKGLDCVYLDITAKGKEFLQKRFPTIYSKCLSFGLDISQEPIPVVPAAHYMCGGVLVDTFGRSSLSGLLVLGEASCTGLHGGNRLASNSLLEAVVYAEKSFEYCKSHWSAIRKKDFPVVDPWKAGEAQMLDEEILINHNWDLLRRVMWNYVGIVRSVKRLNLAKKQIDEISREIEQHYRDYYVTANMVELRNLSLVASLIIKGALDRKESRGLHYVLDYPQTNAEYLKWKIFEKKM